MKPLVEVTQVILDDLEIDGVAALLDDANVTGVERARNRNGHEQSLVGRLLTQGRPHSAARADGQTQGKPHLSTNGGLRHWRPGAGSISPQPVCGG
jgi:hypothetical protein